MNDSSGRGCLQEKEISDVKCDICIPGCLFYGGQPGEEAALLEALSAELELLAEEVELKNSDK